ncbi:MAG TPA: hypothetical protein VG937_37125 [Polyangiaceae bacterium]|nr:hypothetical protein [Polyangiaceae bacterium]
MGKIGIFYHTRLDGGSPPIDSVHALRVLGEQIGDLLSSGLYEAASEITFGVNASSESAQLCRTMSPSKIEVVHHTPEYQSELPTFSRLRQWLEGHQDWYVLYHQAKGVRSPNSEVTKAWRRCMSRHLVHNWRECVADLDRGFDAVGCHWLTPEQFPRIRTPYFGGNFWWAKASFLATLPELPVTASCREDFYLAETWIGRGPQWPKVRDYAPHWPGLEECSVASMCSAAE